MGEVKIGRMTLGSCATNCYFLYTAGAEEVIVIDPGDTGKLLFDKLSEKGFKVGAILLTHGHFDHIYGVAALKKLSGAKVYAGEFEQELLENEELNLSDYFGRPTRVEADVYLRDGEVLTLCGVTFKVIHTPGHTGGSICFYIESEGFLIDGDTLFYESVGRTDFPSGNSRVLINSIKEKLFALPAETKVYPGHGEPTSIGHETENNPFIQ